MEFGGGESVISSRYPPLEASPREKRKKRVLRRYLRTKETKPEERGGRESERRNDSL
jgi:hypothetical protein